MTSHSIVTSLKTRSLPWFGLATVLAVLGFAALRGTPQGVAVAVAMLVFFGACIRAIGLAVRDNPVSAQMISRSDIIHRTILSESGASRRGR
jgi:hypothetical protein